MAGQSTVDRVKLDTKCSVLTDGRGIPLDWVTTPANRNDSALMCPIPGKLSPIGFHLSH